MTQLLEHYPADIEEVIFITHSMGGLVTRSACYYGSQQDNPWTDKVRQLYFLGSPHLGADLEKFGSVVASVLKNAPLPYTNLLAEVYNMRSAGIKDLRFGYVTDEDWQDQDQNEALSNNKQTVPLLEGADHFVITGTVFKDNQKVLNEFFGDALVRRHSATGGHPEHRHHLPFLPENQKEFETINHLKMAVSEEVYQQIRIWVIG
jgi:triacylglycerol esterase/lipase EstA (alpha/beta hydrolase family)